MNDATRREADFLASGLVHVVFEIERDEDGWPPATSERLWAEPIRGNLYRLDNTPFFYVGVSYNDVVQATERSGRLTFESIWQHSGHSTLRIIMLERKWQDRVLADLPRLGATYEGAGPAQPLLFALDVRPNVDIREIQKYLAKEEGDGVLGFEESNLVHLGVEGAPHDEG